jgi:hypothetical protein
MPGATQEEANREAIKKAARARIDRIKDQLFGWIAENCTPADAMPMTIAFLEIAIEGHLVMSNDEAETLDLVTKLVRRMAHKPVGQVQ